MTEKPQKYIRVTFDIPIPKDFIPIKMADFVLGELLKNVNEKTELIKFEVLTDE
jgi:hypothetical protein